MRRPLLLALLAMTACENEPERNPLETICTLSVEPLPESDSQRAWLPPYLEGLLTLPMFEQGDQTLGLERPWTHDDPRDAWDTWDVQLSEDALTLRAHATGDPELPLMAADWTWNHSPWEGQLTLVVQPHGAAPDDWTEVARFDDSEAGSLLRCRGQSDPHWQTCDPDTLLPLHSLMSVLSVDLDVSVPYSAHAPLPADDPAWGAWLGELEAGWLPVD